MRLVKGWTHKLLEKIESPERKRHKIHQINFFTIIQRQFNTVEKNDVETIEYPYAEK